MTEPARTAESVALARHLVAEEEWFRSLPASMKDDLSQPNHDRQMAETGLRLARLLLERTDG